MSPAAQPVGGIDYPRTYQEFRSWFPDDHACREYLATLRWPDGFSCPHCGCGSCWQVGKGLRMCAQCSVKTSVTAGTIFHRSHTPLSTWFAAVWFVTSQKNGVSAQGLYDALGFGSYETAWAWLHKLRRAMVRPDRELRPTWEHSWSGPSSRRRTPCSERPARPRAEPTAPRPPWARDFGSPWAMPWTRWREQVSVRGRVDLTGPALSRLRPPLGRCSMDPLVKGHGVGVTQASSATPHREATRRPFSRPARSGPSPVPLVQ